MKSAAIARFARTCVFVALVLIGPSTFASAQETDALQLVERYVAAWNAHDPTAAEALLADDARYFNTGIGKDVPGRAAVRKTLRGLLSILPDLHWSIIGKPVVGPTGAAFEWEVAGTYTPQGQATAKAVRVRGATFITTRDGRVAYLADYYDGESMRQQLAP